MFVVVCDLFLLNVIWLTMCYKECKYRRVFKFISFKTIVYTPETELVEER